ncbi:hypothetical protein G7Y89_g14475 [Cudoniella acicularis]|uniref:DUF6604 domain-containing protein n=1 Tax=Cudoniella acicularis TaxID=354080 RepID=A0A8H4VVJ0_9HELO|nr:hypothetical protein G7Y89_g14475 [Cudoniella acicularis]
MDNFRILDTYKAYKLREKKFTGWLRETAAKIGYTSSTTRPKNTTNAGDGPTIRISEIPHLVRLIASRGLEIPEHLCQVLRDVISQRKEASAFYKPQGQAAADQGHAYYIQVLEGALKTFENSRSSDSSEASSSRTSATVGPSSSRAENTLSNVFELLRVDNVNNEASTEAGMSGSESGGEAESDKENQSSKKGKSKVRFGKRKGKARKTQRPQQAVVRRHVPTTDIEVFDAISQFNDLEEDVDDLYFMIYCFFKDFNALREYIQERWCDYQDGLISLSAISVATNTAFELIQRSEQELLAQIPVRSGLRDYEAMADMLFIDVGLAHVDYAMTDTLYGDNEEDMNEAIAQEADFLCLPRYWDLYEWLANTPPKKISTMGRLFENPVNYRARGSHERIARDRQILYEMISECTLIKSFKVNTSSFSIPAEDEFTRGLVEMLATRKLPIWLILTSQIYCDIRWILEENVTECHTELQAMGGRVEQILNDYLDFVEPFEIPVRPAIQTTAEEIECWITNDFAEPNRTELHVSHGESEDQEPYYYLRRNPILCGLMIFRFSLTMNELGLDNSNQWGATIAAAHLYNAIRHELPSFPQWLDMEALILIHSTQRIFWRDTLPRNPSQYAISYERATGVSEMINQRKMHSNTIVPRKIEERGIQPVSVVSKQFWRRFCFAHSRPVRTLPNVEAVLNQAADREILNSLEGLRLLESSSDAGSSSSASNTLDSQLHAHLAGSLYSQFRLLHLSHALYAAFEDGV